MTSTFDPISGFGRSTNSPEIPFAGAASASTQVASDGIEHAFFWSGSVYCASKNLAGIRDGTALDAEKLLPVNLSRREECLRPSKADRRTRA